MRILFLFVFALSNIIPCYGYVLHDTTSNVRVSAKLQVSNVGLAPVPAFSFNSPIVFGFLTVKKQAFSFEPDVAVGMNGKPWMTNNWFRFTVFDRNKWKANLGVNPSLFFEYETLGSGEKIIRTQRNLTFEAAVTYKSNGWNLGFLFMNINGCDPGTLSGNFFNIHGEFTAVHIREKIFFNLKPQLFYFNFNSNSDGFFAASALDIKHINLPLTVFTQGVLPLWADFPTTGFKWNFGMLIIL
ncbi:hypothetical protein [Chryseolinea sp. H1M3-3]|uniref:hypothetical protein n=1 Tax=Chryseolinea sp. H1M3-3 TaxID=3034144 RepID=UPI0023EB416D|nr:hypothetical protein [Chryseolinea sp. H1M3-3]